MSIVHCPFFSFLFVWSFVAVFANLHQSIPGICINHCIEYRDDSHSIQKSKYESNMADSQITPAMPPPPGKRSNFVNPEYQGTKFIVVNCIFLPMAVVALAVRTWTRVFIVRNFRSDDCMCPADGYDV